MTEELNNSDVLHAHSATGGNFGFSVVEDAANITPIRADATNELVLWLQEIKKKDRHVHFEHLDSFFFYHVFLFTQVKASLRNHSRLRPKL